ncbi:hypothetical protein L6164_022271 [Bauhinia variegata]|uniref:Uncharacterized protein n=1 Tax=Bauhinia variegata TaxID=167791 RepID=A0ACB9MGF9_BAUVA|nr:hypothetical protein L6164_022271 [Bauhinia variegata]
MKNCELCKVPARTFCESDEASLCWDCDAKVHGANFLVARHSRTLLCHACQSPTPWKASGAKLGNAVSVCESCAGGMKVNNEGTEESEGNNDNEIDTEDDLDDDDYDDDSMAGEDDDAVGGDEDGDNQVVPWSSTPPPPSASYSSSEESANRCNNSDRDISETGTMISLKRRRENASDLMFQEGLNGWSSQQRHRTELTGEGAWLPVDGEGSSVEVEPLKDGKTTRAASHSVFTNESIQIFKRPRSARNGDTFEAV